MWGEETPIKEIAVIGLGNILLRDEGVGVHVANAIKQRYTFTPEVEIIDGGTMGLDLLPVFEGRDRVLIIDAVDFQKEPGHIGVIENENIPSVLNSKLSVHHINLTDVIYASKLMNILPSEIFLVGIQPESLDAGLDMTDTINKKINALIEIVLERLKQWGVECALLSLQGS